MKNEQIAKKVGLTIETCINSITFNSDTDNMEIIEMLNDECSFCQTLLGQETWSFNDGSYITRNDTDYFFGDDITDFECTADMYSDSET